MITVRDPAHHVRIVVFAMSLTLFSTTSSAQILESDRQALIDLYHATNGDNWIDNSNWLTSDINTWHGVDTSRRRIAALNLSGNNLTGEIPYTLGNLWWLRTLNLQNNPNLTGTLPISLKNLSRLERFWFDGTGMMQT